MSSRETTEKGYYWDVRRARLPDFGIKRADTMQISKVPKVTAVPSVAWISKLPRLPRVPQALMFLSVPGVTNTPRSPGFHSSLGRIFPERFQSRLAVYGYVRIPRVHSSFKARNVRSAHFLQVWQSRH